MILISGLSLVGYVLTRWLGPGRGAAVTGLAGGLASSTAVSLSFAREARDNPQNTAALACGILLSWAVMFARVLVLVAVVNRALLKPMLVPFALMAVAVAGFAALIYLRDRSETRNAASSKDLDVKNPFSLTSAAKFAAFFAVVLLAVKIVQEHFPPGGLYAVAALAGLTDVDAITLSMSDFAKSSDARVAVIAIVIAALVEHAGEMRHRLRRCRPVARQAAADRHGSHLCRSCRGVFALTATRANENLRAFICSH